MSLSDATHQSEEQPRETEFLHLPLGANKARDELTADGVKAPGVEIASHSFITVRQKAGFPISVFSISVSRFPPLSVFRAPCLQREGYRSFAANLATQERCCLVSCLKAVIFVRPDSSITDRYKAQSLPFQ